MRITICFGGSILVKKEPRVEVLKEIRETLNDLKEDEHDILVVTGGGKVSRSYIKIGKEMGVSNKILDEIGIQATRLNAQLLIGVLGDLASLNPKESFESAVQEVLRGKIPVMGGTVPGHTTDAVSAELADNSNSDMLVFFTNVDGVYTANPKTDENAKKIDSMSAKELLDLAKKEKFSPGMSAIIDPLAAEILQKSKIKALVLGEGEIERLPEILKGSEHSGTTVLPD
ncbi:MAG: UMP kinase [Hadesarchaea archaeon]|nr:UMP kinase [Hadesarchaea archaeon]